MMAARASQSSSLPSPARFSARPAATSAPTQLLAASLQPSVLFPFPVDACLPGSPLSRSLSRQLFTQPPPNSPSAVSSGYPAASLLPATGFGADVSAKLDQRDGHQQLLRYLSERHSAAQLTAASQHAAAQQSSHFHSHHPQLLHQGPSIAGGGSSVLPGTSAFSALSSLPPPLSHPPLPAPFPPDFGSPSPNSPSDRTHPSQSAASSVLCQSPSSTLSSSSHYSVDDAFDYEVELLADHFHMPLQHFEPRTATQRLLHSQPATYALSSHFAAVAAPLPADEVPALPTSGDMPPGCLLWQQEMEMEKHQLWSHTAQQLVNSIQQQHQAAQRRPQQPYRESEQQDGDEEEEEEERDSESSEAAAIDGSRAGRAGGGDLDGSSSSGDSGSRSVRRVHREGSRSPSRSSLGDRGGCGSEASSCEEAERRSRFAPRHASKQQRGSRGGGKSGRHKRSKKRKRSQCHEESSDADQSDGGQREHKRRGGRGKTEKGKVRKSGASQSSSPLYSPSPSSFSTSTAASAPSACSSTQRSTRRPCGGHRSKLPARVVAILRSFFLQHVSHPFPGEEQKRELVGRTGLSMKQVCDWFTNNRKRYWKPYERKMDRLHCQLVGAAYKSAQHSATGPARRNNRAADREHDRSARAAGQLRTVCRCGEEDVAIHDWRQMWD